MDKLELENLNELRKTDLQSTVHREAALREPFLLKPAAKDYLWGGNRLNDDFGKGIDLSPLAETWECSTHPDGPSTIASGQFAGKLLPDFIEKHPEVLGTHPMKVMKGVEDQCLAGDEPLSGDKRFSEDSGSDVAGEHTTSNEIDECRHSAEVVMKKPIGLPVLIKFIDAKKDLSVQVHPDDEYARTHEGGQLGKTEMWYVLSAAPGASLVYGFRRDVTAAELRRRLQDGSVERDLQKVPIHKDDVFLVKAGTVHAIGAGALIVEIQESSNLTYRLYDYNRVGKDGKKRELHVEKALAVADLHATPKPKQPMRVLKYRPGWASEMLGRCKYFEVWRVLLNTEIMRSLVPMQADGTSFRVLLCVDGCGSIAYGGSSVSESDNGPGRDDRSGSENGRGTSTTILNFFKGDCIFIPANSLEVRLHGKAQLLMVTC